MTTVSVCIYVMKFMSEKGFYVPFSAWTSDWRDKTDSECSNSVSCLIFECSNSASPPPVCFCLWAVGEEEDEGYVCGGVFGFFLSCCVTSWRSECWSLSSSAHIKDRSVWGSVPALRNNAKITEWSSLTFDLSALTDRNKSVQTHSSSDSSPGLTLTLNPHWDLQECFNIRFNPDDSDLDCFSSERLNQNPDVFRDQEVCRYDSSYLTLEQFSFPLNFWINIKPLNYKTVQTSN